MGWYWRLGGDLRLGGGKLSSAMQSLQEQASQKSGVPLDEAFQVDEVNLYERLGHQVFIDLSTNFYTR